MELDNLKISDVIKAEYSDFLEYCSLSGKEYVSELTNVDFVAFRTTSGQSREYIRAIKELLENPAIIAEAGISRSQECKKNREYIALEDVDDPSGNAEYSANEGANCSADIDTYPPAAPDGQSIDALQSILAGAICTSESINVEKEPTAIEPKIAETSINFPTLTTNSGLASERSEYTLAQLFDVNPSWFEGVSIIELNLSVRPSNCLEKANIKTIAEVLTKTADEIKALKNMGVKSVSEIVQKARAYTANPANIQRASLSDTYISPHMRKPIAIDLPFKTALEAMLMGDEYSTELPHKRMTRMER